MVSPYHATGFYFAPVTKGLTGGVLLSSIAFILPLSHQQHHFHSTYHTLFEQNQLVKFLLSKLVFLDPKDVLCAGILLYHFRIFERRYGSLKFASYLLTTWSLSMMLEAAALWTSHQLSLSLEPMPTGPFGMVFSMFVPYFCDVPRVAMTHVMGVPVTGKSLTYIIGLQMGSVSIESAILMGCGIVSGILHRKLKLGQVFKLPTSIGNLFQQTLGRVIATPAPPDLQRPLGATLELQRQQQVEALEQQMAWAQLQQRRPRAGNGFGLGIFRNNENAGQQPNLNGNPAAAQPPSEEQVQQLLDMGFTRPRVVRALQASNNDITMATNILLHDAQ